MTIIWTELQACYKKLSSRPDFPGFYPGPIILLADKYNQLGGKSHNMSTIMTELESGKIRHYRATELKPALCSPSTIRIKANN